MSITKQALILAIVLALGVGTAAGWFIFYSNNRSANADGGGGSPYGGRTCSPDNLPVQDATARETLGVEALDENAIAIKKDIEDILARLNKVRDGASNTDLKPLLEVLLNNYINKLTQDSAKKLMDQIAEVYGLFKTSDLYGVKFSGRLSEAGTQTLSTGKLGNKLIPLGAKQSTYLSDRSMDGLMWNKGVSGNFSASVFGNASKITADITGTLDYGFKFSKDNPATIRIGFKCTNGVGQYGMWNYDQSGKALALPQMHINLKQGDLNFSADFKNTKEYGLLIRFDKSFGVRK